jgi:hypothetical protein
MYGEGDPAAVRNRPLSNNGHDRAQTLRYLDENIDPCFPLA